MNGSLRDRLRRLDTHLATRDLKPDVAVWLACDLFTSGIDPSR